MCRFIETICVIDGEPLAIDAHRARVRRTLRACWGGAAGHRVDSAAHAVLEQALAAALNDGPNAGAARTKLRLVYRVPPENDGEPPAVEELELLSYRVPPITTLRVVDGGEITYSLKYHNRRALHRLYELRDGCDDVLIVRDGLLTDSSYCNIALYDAGRCITPATPLLAGTRRARLLQAGRLVAADIPVQSIERYSHVALFNAMIDLGELVLPITALRTFSIS